jgi:hypothetical protein
VQKNDENHKKKENVINTTSKVDKEILDLKSIPSIEDVTNKDKDNMANKEKLNKNKKGNKAKPVELDIKLSNNKYIYLFLYKKNFLV